VFAASTERAVAEFQGARGLHVHGRCDEPTWTALVEASYQLGDRTLVLSAPNMRGDDVGALQSVLARLGFDCGRVDGILGPTTTRALEDFQRNCGLTPDGICGPETVRALDVLGRQSGSGPGVAALREFEALSGSCRRLDDLRVVIGQFGGMSSLTRQVTHALRQRGATVTATDEPDAPAQAATANRFAATVYVGFEARAETVATVCYYAVPTFESSGGRSLATRLVHMFEKRVPDIPLQAHGMRLPVLRETRMPAVLCAIGPVQDVIDLNAGVAAAVVEALESWADAPFLLAGGEAPAAPPPEPGLHL
jgi:N-acetylmuramoyl-L-alanine amidase